jgi:hypothetical protein
MKMSEYAMPMCGNSWSSDRATGDQSSAVMN